MNLYGNTDRCSYYYFCMIIFIIVIESSFSLKACTAHYLKEYLTGNFEMSYSEKNIHQFNTTITLQNQVWTALTIQISYYRKLLNAPNMVFENFCLWVFNTIHMVIIFLMMTKVNFDTPASEDIFRRRQTVQLDRMPWIYY